jgi:S1-C subfamily serine protease
MSVNNPSPTSPPAPEWIPVGPPWSTPPPDNPAAGAGISGGAEGQWLPPTSPPVPPKSPPMPPPMPPGGAAGGPYGPWGAPPPAPDQPTPRPSQRARAALSGALIAVVMAGFLGVGVGIGSRLHRGSSVPNATAANTTTPGTGVVPTTPSTGDGSTSAPASSGTGTSISSQAAAIAAKVDPAVVDINTKLAYQNAAAAGTGLVLSSTGEILTNNHVIDGATSISVTLVTTGRSYPATVVGTDPTADIAVLQLQGASGLKTINAASSAVAVGDSVVAIGNAGGAGGTPAVVTGTVQALNQTITASDQNGANAEQLTNLIQTDAPIQPGDSGGPLVNTAGQVVGIDTAASGGNRFNSATSVGFAIPIGDAEAIATQIESGHASATIHLGPTAFLGVAIVPDSSSSGSSISATGGAVVAGAASGTPAAAAGLAQGDTITAVGGQTVGSAQALSSIMRSHRPGDKVSVSWTDQAGASHTATLTLATGPAD